MQNYIGMKEIKAMPISRGLLAKQTFLLLTGY
nr:MAG TPA: hypothetical protein [Caudoviricetes sp.]